MLVDTVLKTWVIHKQKKTWRRHFHKSTSSPFPRGMMGLNGKTAGKVRLGGSKTKQCSLTLDCSKWGLWFKRCQRSLLGPYYKGKYKVFKGNDHHWNLFQALHIRMHTLLIKLPHMCQQKLKVMWNQPNLGIKLNQTTVIVKNSSPLQLSANCQASVGGHTADSRSVDQQEADSWLTDNWQTAGSFGQNCWPTVCWQICQLLANCWWPVSEVSVSCRLQCFISIAWYVWPKPHLKGTLCTLWETVVSKVLHW